MLNSAYPKHYKVVAVSPEITPASESAVLQPMVFLEGRETGSMYWTQRKHWRLKDLKEVRPEDRKFISLLPEEYHVGINEGESVYYMGEKFHGFISKLITEGCIDFSLNAWHPSVSRHYCAVMTRSAFDAFRASLSYEIWPLIENFIVESGETRTDIFELFESYNHLIGQHEHEKQIHALRAGAFYRAYGDEKRFKVFSWVVVKKDAVFPSEEEYVTVLDRYITSLKSLRMSALDKVTPVM